jgi:hypothetical protein
MVRIMAETFRSLARRAAALGGDGDPPRAREAAGDRRFGEAILVFDGRSIQLIVFRIEIGKLYGRGSAVLREAGGGG